MLMLSGFVDKMERYASGKSRDFGRKGLSRWMARALFNLLALRSAQSRRVQNNGGV